VDHTGPPEPSYGVLIELARKAAGITIQRAAGAAGVSKATWIDNVRGYRKRGNAAEPVYPKPETIAHMAHAVGVTPERMETEGGLGDAAAILREILRRDEYKRALVEELHPSLLPYQQSVRRDIARAVQAHGPEPTGAQIFADAVEAAVWDSPRWNKAKAERMVAELRQAVDEAMSPEEPLPPDLSDAGIAEVSDADIAAIEAVMDEAELTAVQKERLLELLNEAVKSRRSV
jgi:transcriptional regulator with XRE-family HTH domain